MSAKLIYGHSPSVLRSLPAESIDCCVTSPPYWGLRSYGTADQVWGGAPECEHQWGDRFTIRDIREETITGKTRTTERFFGEESRRFNGNNQKLTDGQFCLLCGAWFGSLGLEPTYDLYIDHIVAVFYELWRVLRTEGTCWLNLGDCFATGAGKVGECPGGGDQGERWSGYRGTRPESPKHSSGAIGPMTQPNRMPQIGLKPKDLCMIPHRTAIALQDKWWVRMDIVWNKANPMPESVADRPTKAHEYVFLLSKSEKYYYDAAAIREPFATDPKENYPERATITGRGDQEYAQTRGNDRGKSGGFPPASHKGSAMNKGKTAIHQLGRSSDAEREDNPLGRNKRSVWNISTRPFPEAHFAVMPEELVTPCILAGCPEGGTVLDPFAGSGTVGVVALKHGRKFIGIDLNRNYVEMARRRLNQVNPLFNPECGVAEEYARDKGEEENV